MIKANQFLEIIHPNLAIMPFVTKHNLDNANLFQKAHDNLDILQQSDTMKKIRTIFTITNTKYKQICSFKKLVRFFYQRVSSNMNTQRSDFDVIFSMLIDCFNGSLRR